MTADGPSSPRQDDPVLTEDGGTLPPGTRLAEFELIKVLGDGGFGVVYLAHDHSLGRTVALKEYMPSSFARRTGMVVSARSAQHGATYAAGLRSFVNEAQLLARFDHPSLVKVYRFWEGNGTGYMVMPFYEGVTLKQRLRELGAPPSQAWLGQLLEPLIDALATIHAENCFHRDISPDNIILLAGSGRPLLLDFGAARRVISDMTQALTAIVKPGYAPLEQYAQVPGTRQGPWTDVYAVCAVLHYAITGRTPPPAVGRVMSDTFEGLSDWIHAGYTPEFLAAIERGLRVRPEERTATIEQLAHELGLRLPLDLEIGEPDATSATRPLGVGAASTGIDLALDVALPKGYEPTVLTPRESDAAAPAAAGLPRTAYVRPPPVTIHMPAAGLADRPAPEASAQPSAVAAPSKQRRLRRVAWAAAALLLVGGLGAWLVLRDRGPSPAAPLGSAAPPAPVREPAPAAPVPLPPPAGAAPGAVVTSPVAGPSLREQIVREFDRIEAARHADYEVRAGAGASTLRIGHDLLGFNVSSNRDGYLYVLLHGPDDSLLLLYPNQRAIDNRIRAGETLRLPQKSWPLEASDPPGVENFIAIVSAHRRDFSALRPVADGWFQRLGIDGGPLQAAAKGSALGGVATCDGADCDRYGVARFSITIAR